MIYKLIINVLALIVLIIIGIILFYNIKWFLFQRPKENKRGWRTKSSGRDNIIYQEKIENEWKGIEIQGEMLVGRKSKVLYFNSEKEWKRYPEWAQNRNQIIERIKMEWPPERTEYQN
ncbi:hypothetical protein E7Z59_07125 [Robertkochia marina]|uniref:Uncharacterized protein n=1 Tax=Robertkochia marina TaxID=1227945 RepID=A0A4S3M066_9FLAO|nr:hypothetical protein [Robertkochia marina]THD67427.1 hypothetical protein E7Z59_07125 [Robertkochia marina]TRZ40785.1 hypothetical protein D3A96_15340 [Robertkochia marina]